MPANENEASAWKAGTLAGVTTAIIAKLVLVDNYPVRPTPDVLLTGLLLAVCVGVSVGYGWARVQKELEQHRRSAADTASATERQTKALVALACHGNELRRAVSLIEDGALPWERGRSRKPTRRRRVRRRGLRGASRRKKRLR